MIKRILFALVFCVRMYGAADIEGFWKSIDEKTGNPQCVVAIYEYENMYYGRMIGTFDLSGKMTETIDHPKTRAPGLVDQPYYCGLDLIWNLEPAGSSYKGKIVDPEKGNIYNAELWTKNGNLIVRGKLLFFGRNQEWVPTQSSDFPKNFKMPDVTKFVPVIPQTK